MTPMVRRATAVCGFGYLLVLIANIAFTADGPRPVGDVPTEVERLRSVTSALRWSALLGEVGALLLGGVVVGLTLLLLQRARPTQAVVAGLAGTATVVLSLVSFAALVASAQSADTGLGADAIMGLGHLHTTTLLLSFSAAAIMVLASASGGLWGRTGTVLSVIVGVCGLLASAALLQVKQDTGTFGLPLVIVFWGVPVWAAALGYRQIRPRRSAAASV